MCRSTSAEKLQNSSGTAVFTGLLGVAISAWCQEQGLLGGWPCTLEAWACRLPGRQGFILKTYPDPGESGRAGPPQASWTRPGVCPASHWFGRVRQQGERCWGSPKRDFAIELNCGWRETSTNKNEDQNPQDLVVCQGPNRKQQ